MKKLLRAALAAAVATVTTLAIPGVANACLRDEVLRPGASEAIAHIPTQDGQPSPYSPSLELQEAERLLEQGGVANLELAIRNAQAVRTWLRAEPTAASAVPGLTREDLENAAERLVRRATVLEHLGFSRRDETSASDRAKGIDEITRMRAEHADVVPDATWGELLSRVPGRTDEGYAILSKLAQKDLLGSAWEHAALASLARTRGERVVSHAAEVRCEALAWQPAICAGTAGAAPFSWEATGRKALAHAQHAGFGLGGLGLVAFVALRRKRRTAEQSG